MANTQEDGGAHHPGVGEYVQIGVILAVITAIEVGLFYADIIRQVTVGALLFLTVLKFSLVVLWFMHLRFDSPLYRRLFVGGLLLAAAVFTVAGLTL
ncbi:MAG TPA: cytochrome C oxidase subunit IV family protein [Egibacteraceae bacterium]|nr:cytochrome C oxidase subunit IV family protein [Egibacteraceae bacterium]